MSFDTSQEPLERLRERQRQMAQMTSAEATAGLQEQMQFSSHLFARFVLLTAPPRVALVAAFQALKLVASFEAAEGETLHEVIQATRDSVQETLATIAEVPPAQWALDPSWDVRVTWMLFCLTNYAPGAPSGLGGFAEKLLLVLGGDAQDDPIFEKVVHEVQGLEGSNDPLDANVGPLARHLLTTFEARIGERMQANPRVRVALQGV